MKPTHFCKDCRKPCNLKQHDFGVGVTEAYGRRENHVDVRTVTSCCESEDFFDSERECREDLQFELSDKLNNADTLSLGALETIEKIIAADLKRQQAPQPVQPHQGNTVINLVDLCENILLAGFPRGQQ